MLCDHFTMNVAIPILAAFLYALSALLAAIRLFSGGESAPVPRAAVIIAGFGAVLLHSMLLYQNIVADSGLNLAFFQAFSLSAWMVATVLLISTLNKPVENLAIIIFPIVAIAILAANFSDSSNLLRADSGWSLGMHVVTSLLAWSLFSIASVQAILLAIQDRHLHNRHPGGFIKALPPLQTMESLLFEMISAGLILLTLALLTGFIFLDDMFAQHLVHKTILSICAWIVFAVLLWGRYRYGWRGRRAVYWTLAGFVVLLLAYFGSKAVVELILQRPV